MGTNFTKEQQLTEAAKAKARPAKAKSKAKPKLGFEAKPVGGVAVSDVVADIDRACEDLDLSSSDGKHDQGDGE